MDPIEGPVHLIGAGGVHMAAIGQLLLEQGIEVTGSDRDPGERTRKLEAMGATIYGQHDPSNIADPKLVVISAAIRDYNPELKEAQRRNLPIILRGEMVGRLIAGKRLIGVAGSHGKTTTSSLIAWILTQTGLDPMFLLGSEVRALGGQCAWGKGDLCVVEADEYRSAFLEYDPAVAVVTNIDVDHLDYYGTPEVYKQAFDDFAARIIEGGRVYICSDDARAMTLVTRPDVERTTYGLQDGAEWQARNIKKTATGSSFELYRGGELLGELATSLVGDHYVADITVAVAVCLGEGVPFARVASALEAFAGAQRRFEFIGEVRGITVIDTYAHHPSEVRADLRAARDRFGDRRIVVLFQPYTYSRTTYLWDEWLACWDDADVVAIVDTFGARETADEGLSGKPLAEAMGVPFAPDLDAAVGMGASLIEPGDVVFTMGAGNVYEVAPKLLEALA